MVLQFPILVSLRVSYVFACPFFSFVLSNGLLLNNGSVMLFLDGSALPSTLLSSRICDFSLPTADWAVKTQSNRALCGRRLFVVVFSVGLLLNLAVAPAMRVM
jgi:hypothetical protein